MTASNWLMPLLRPHRGRIAVGVAAVLVSTAVTLTTPYLFKVAVDDGMRPGHTDVLTWLALAWLALAGLRLLAGRIETLAVASVGQRTLTAVRHTVFAHLQRLPLAYYQRERSAGIVALMTGDVDAITGLVSGGVIELGTSLLTFVGIAIILAVLDWRLALVTLTVVPVLSVAVRWFRGRSGTAWQAARESAADTTVALSEIISGAGEIQAYRSGPRAVRALIAVSDRARRANYRTVTPAALFFPGVELSSVVAVAVVVAAGGPRVLDGGLEISTLAAFVLYLQVLFGPVFNLSEVYSTAQAAMAGVRRVGAVLAVVPAVGESATPVALADPKGHVRFEDVRFAYPAPDGSTGADVLRGVTLDVPAGTTLAIVGPSGAGKSTVASMLLRFHDPAAGRVTLDGVDLRDARVRDLRTAVSFVPQEGFLFAGTVADNIRFGRPGAGGQDIEDAITAIGAWPLVDRLTDGLETEVGERGSRLAGGEQQVIALARAWIADPAVLVLDEATGRMARETEELVRTALRRLRGGRTTVVIAHRLTGILDVDQVAVLADGQVVECAPPADLIAAAGQFADLYRRWTRTVADQVTEVPVTGPKRR
jgi:ATP-binding cassette subfamily B protein